MHLVSSVEPALLARSSGTNPANSNVAGDILVVEPRHLGIGRDMMVGGPGRPQYRFIDLTRLKEPVMIHWDGADCGSITDGADSIVFQGVEDILLPDCMASQRRNMV